jgi:SAM-dependent methyltransferase
MCCTDISPDMIRAGKSNVHAAGLSTHFTFAECDVNSSFPEASWDAIIANHCLHHFVELEYIFTNVKKHLGHGAFVVSDMIGRNGHMRWPEVLRLVEGAWAMLPPHKRYDCINRVQRTAYVNYDCAEGTFEGIRAQDILPLMIKNFYFERFLGYGGIPDIFVDRMYGPNFDPNEGADTSFVDFLELLNQSFMRAGVTKPTMMFATVRNSAVPGIFDPLHPFGAVRMADWRTG